jgi:hypothetical protein
MVSGPDWLNRYRKGDRGNVWAELLEAGSAVRDPRVSAEAQLVCDEMARRARRNVEMIVGRLSGQGYRFHLNDEAQTPVQPHIAPTAAAAEHACWLEERFGPVPMTLLSWARLVGDVWLVGTHPRWGHCASADPLVIQLEGSHYPGSSIRDYFDEDYRRWGRRGRMPGHGPFVLPLAPDKLHKENVSGGSPYGMILPDARADGQFAGATTAPFVSYLNEVFRNGGFPHPTGSDTEQPIKQDLARDLLPL